LYEIAIPPPPHVSIYHHEHINPPTSSLAVYRMPVLRSKPGLKP
jgi:hypothetical protein